ncbi:hypothetical protein MKY91_09320 [Alkalicoccobacillus gibsonii]|uniref:Uncharacterized protein n=1 Tax=Alkalicoccobacillus gibsonii TaxID=79881 RepID=A0ABU9VHF3_9BACI
MKCFRGLKDVSEQSIPILISAIIVILAPVFTLIFAFRNEVKADEIYIAMIGISAALAGGFVSGFITLKGVNKTINHQRTEKYIENYAIKTEAFQNMKLQFYKMNGEDFVAPSQKFTDNLFIELLRNTPIISAELHLTTIETQDNAARLVQAIHKKYLTESKKDRTGMPTKLMDTNYKSSSEFKDLDVLFNKYKEYVIKKEKELNNLVRSFQP